jgi:hypothetical protein
LLHQNTICNSPNSHTCHMFSPSHFSRYYNPNYILCGIFINFNCSILKIWKMVVTYSNTLLPYLYSQIETNKSVRHDSGQKGRMQTRYIQGANLQLGVSRGSCLSILLQFHIFTSHRAPTVRAVHIRHIPRSLPVNGETETLNKLCRCLPSSLQHVSHYHDIQC